MPTKLKISDLLGVAFGRLTITGESSRVKGKLMVICKCTCGNDAFAVSYNALQRDNTKSCGCIRIEKPNRFIDGRKKHPLYVVYNSMIKRCYNKNHQAFKNYGGRGIDVCPEWAADFAVFFSWAIDNGWAKGIEIDRVNNDLGYSPDNCRFVTRRENMRNTRMNKMVTFNGQTKALATWVEELGLKYSRTAQRLGKLGWSPEKAFMNVKFRA